MIVVGGASLKVCFFCGRSFTEGVIVVGGASLKEEQICQSLRVSFSTNSHIKHLFLPAINCIYVSVTITNSWYV